MSGPVWQRSGSARSGATDGATPTTGAAVARSASPEFLTDLALASLAHERRSLDTSIANRPRILALLLALQPEVVRLSILSASCASIANALVRPRKVRVTPKPRAVLRYFPSESARYILAASRFRRRSPGSPATQRLDDVHAALTRAVDCTIAFAASGFDTAAASTLNHLATAWSDTCAADAALLEAIDAELGAYMLATGSTTSTPLREVLAMAASGGTPFLADDGTICLPAWAELRRTPRIPVRCAATLDWKGGRSDVTVVDISTLGAGIETSARLTKGESVMLIVDRSIAMPGRIAWVNGQTAGIEYDQPFYVDAPEFRFITRSYGE